MPYVRFRFSLYSVMKTIVYVYVLPYALVNKGKDLGITCCLPQEGGNAFIRIVDT
jgi:hypothetical protein